MPDSTRRTVETDWGNANPAGVIAPAQATQDNGYAAVKPPYQEHNWIFQLVTSMLQSAEKNGIMEWRSTTKYNQNGLTFGSDGKKYQSQVSLNTGNDPVLDNGTNWVPWLETNENPFMNYAAFQYTTSSGSNGVALPSATWTTIPLNETHIANNITGVSISSGQITLPVGSWRVKFWGIGSRDDESSTQSRLRNITNSNTVGVGGSITVSSTSDRVPVSGVSSGVTEFDTTSITTIELQQWINNDGFIGRDLSSGEDNLYSQIEIWKIA